MTDRIAGLLLVAVAIAVWISSGTIEAGFGDPVGPALFPRLVAAPLGLFALYLLVRPDPEPKWPARDRMFRQGVMLVVLFVYPLLIDPLGFPASTIIATFGLCLLLGARPLQAVIGAICIGAGLYLLFDRVLGLPLPLMPQPIA